MLNSLNRFRQKTWDPILIGSQIVCLQTATYTSISFILMIINAFKGFTNNVDYILSTKYITTGNLVGRYIIIAYVLSSIVSALILWVFIQKAKECLDFAATFFLYHLIITAVYDGMFPRSLIWWIVNIINLIISTIIGEYLCMKSDLKDIPVNQPAISDV
ncbi:hypothetical protein SNEBB_000838 [Seison nebaliae]|nr:hypothetical protein SNEBB_000838 [Seison nebaliae]